MMRPRPPQDPLRSFPATPRRVKFTLLLLLLECLVWLPQPTRAFVPPKPGTELAATYEPVHVYRQRNNMTFHYQPKALHPEMCRYLTPQECQDADESMHRHQQRHRTIQRRLAAQRRRQLTQDLEKDTTTTSRVLRGTLPQDPQAEDDHLPSSTTTTTEKEELEYHMTEFRRTLHDFTVDYSNRQPTREEELFELAQLLKERNETIDQAHLSLLSEHQQRQLERTQPAAHQGRNPRVGTFNVLIFLMRFNDHQQRKLPSRYEYQILWNLRIRKWLQSNGYGKYDAWFEVRNWQTTDQSEKHYAFGQSGRIAAFQESFWPLLDALDKDADWDWSRFDVDDNGLLDNLIVLHSGYAAEEGGQDCTNGREYLDRIWSHAFSDSNGWRNSAGTYGVEGYMIASGLDLTCDSNVAKMGVMTHEYLHTFYLIDLYDYTFEGKGVGMFDIMAYPYGFDNDGYLPVSLSVWAKTAIDWLNCTEVTSSGTYTLEPAALSPSCYRITLLSAEESESDKAEYLLLENRQKAAFDVKFWISGVVIYHIDEAADEQYNRGFPGQSGWPGNGRHYQVAVLQADGKYDLETGENIGDEGDMWTPGMSITPNYDGKTYPNTDRYQSGDIKKSGVVIEVLEGDGRDFNVKITLGSRSGGENGGSHLPSVFAAPSKELPEEAQEQFEVPDAEEFRISGKIPQLPWREKAQEESSITILDSQESSWGARSWVWGMATMLVTCSTTMLL